MFSPLEIPTKPSTVSAVHLVLHSDFFRNIFPEAKMLVLDKNRRSTTTILKSAFALISKNPDVFPPSLAQRSTYQRSPLVSAREEEAAQELRELPSLPVDAVVLGRKGIRMR